MKIFIFNNLVQSQLSLLKMFLSVYFFYCISYYNKCVINKHLEAGRKTFKDLVLMYGLVNAELP